jgi:hypothetical protein
MRPQKCCVCRQFVPSVVGRRFRRCGLLSRGSQVRVLPGALGRVRRDDENPCNRRGSGAGRFGARRRGDARLCASDDAPGRILVASRAAQTARRAPSRATRPVLQPPVGPRTFVGLDPGRRDPSDDQHDLAEASKPAPADAGDLGDHVEARRSPVCPGLPRERLKRSNPSTFCMASRRAGESAPLRGAQKAARTGKPLGRVGVHLAAFGTPIGTTGASARGTGSLSSRQARSESLVRLRASLRQRASRRLRVLLLLREPLHPLALARQLAIDRAGHGCRHRIAIADLTAGSSHRRGQPPQLLRSGREYCRTAGNASSSPPGFKGLLRTRGGADVARPLTPAYVSGCGSARPRGTVLSMFVPCGSRTGTLRTPAPVPRRR